MSGNEAFLCVFFSQLLTFLDSNLSGEGTAISNGIHNALCFKLVLPRDAEPNTAASNSNVNQGTLGSFCPNVTQISASLF